MAPNWALLRERHPYQVIDGLVSDYSAAEQGSKLAKAAEEMGYKPGRIVGPFSRRAVEFKDFFDRSLNNRYLHLMNSGFPNLVSSVEDIRPELVKAILIDCIIPEPKPEDGESFTEYGLPQFNFRIYSQNGSFQAHPEALDYAITEFREKHPAFEDSRNFENQCEIRSIRFCHLAEKYGLDLADAHFLGGTGANPAGVHVVAVNGNTVIDWTVRQYPEHKDAPYPFTYKIGEGQFLGGTVHWHDKSRLELVIKKD